ncbi:MAG: response regulator [Desulfobacterales bacterium]|nr:response regulator [Desulfobacterales bacterium]MDJ0853753.1 response regulator [Desulfobacterales bacterium]MDJ0885735.1 response regulator [Desulfobacterales bacterium]MDJ0989494.1 response regulator [Desulfobacterales bacterium]
MESVLVVDDERSILELFDYALRINGYEVETASDGYEGLQKFSEGRFDLVITDILLNGTDGRDLLERIRSSDKPRTPVIGVSGTPWLLEKTDFDHVLEKPFSIQRLIDSVNGLIKRGTPEA